MEFNLKLDINLIRNLGAAILLLFVLFSCRSTGENHMTEQKEIFGELKDGRSAHLFTLRLEDGSSIKLTDFGAAIVSLQVPDRKGNLEHVVLGFRTLQEYESIRHFYGAIVGRWGNRIAKGEFTLDGVSYHLAVNDGENHLHGGLNGFDRVLWNSEEITLKGQPAIRFSYLSKDGEEGYPGNFSVSVIYTFSTEKEVGIYYEMSSDKATIKNVTNHAYFNLSGNVKKDILTHQLMLNADHFLPVKKGLIPTGEVQNVRETAFDFTKPRLIGERINNNEQQLVYGLGYDHCWVLNQTDSDLNYAGYLYDPESGRRMDIYTTEPGIQFYSGNFMDGTDIGHNGVPYTYRSAVCLETQHFPDSPNQADFPSAVLRPGEIYKSRTVYKFSVQ